MSFLPAIIRDGQIYGKIILVSVALSKSYPLPIWKVRFLLQGTLNLLLDSGSEACGLGVASRQKIKYKRHSKGRVKIFRLLTPAFLAVEGSKQLQGPVISRSTPQLTPQKLL